MNQDVGLELSVVVISYRTPELLDACLTALRPQVTGRREVVVLDNASGDGSAEMVAQRHPWVNLVTSEVNLGFGRGCNEAVRKSSGHYVLLLNPDTVARPDALDGIVAFARRRPDAGIWGGRTVDLDGNLDPKSCWAAPTVWSTACFALGLSRVFPGSRVLDPEAMGSFRRDHERPVDIVTGCLLLTTRELWDRLGGFDERYFMYGEDADLCLRAAAAGARPMITPDATVAHVVGASSRNRPDKLVILLAGKVTVMLTHFGRRRARAAIALLLVGAWLRGRVWGGLTGSSAGWSTVWERRGDWRAGY